MEGNRRSDRDKGLAQASDGRTDRNVEGLTEDAFKARQMRKWHVDTNYDARAMGRFMGRFIDAAKANKIHNFRPAGQALIAALKAAGGDT